MNSYYRNYRLDAPQLVVVYPWNSVPGAAAAARAVWPAAAVSAYSPTPAGPGHYAFTGIVGGAARST